MTNPLTIVIEDYDKKTPLGVPSSAEPSKKNASGSSELGRTLQKNASGSSELGRTLQKNYYSTTTTATVEGQNSGTPFLLIIPEGARVRTRTRVRVRARTMRRCGSAARCCSYRWSWP